MLLSRAWYGASTFTTCWRSQSTFSCFKRLPVWSTMPIIRLLLCRSIPAITCSVIWFPFGSLFVFDRTTTFYRKETFLCQSALNAYQFSLMTLALLYRTFQDHPCLQEPNQS